MSDYESYPFIYKLQPHYEDTKNGGKDWWKLKWKPIFGATYRVTFRNTTLVEVLAA